MTKKIKTLHTFILRHKYIFILFLFALFLRLYGINHGLPLLLNDDEPSFVRSVLGLRFNFRPDRFDWPHANFYLHFIFYTIFYYGRSIFQILNLRVLLEQIFPVLWQDPIIFYLISRVINASLGALTIFPVFVFSRILFKNYRYAFITALFFTLIPNHNFDSHLALLDTAMTFFGSIALVFFAKIINNPSYKNFLLSGLFLGISFGTKYNAIFYFLPFAFFVYYSTKETKILKKIFNLFSFLYIKKILTAFIFFIFGFIFTNPTILIDFDKFWSRQYGRGFLFQFDNVGTAKTADILNQLNEIFFYQLRFSFGLSLYIFLISGIFLYLFFNYRGRINNISILLPILLMVYMSTKTRFPSHYFIFLYPLIAVFLTNILITINDFLISENSNFPKYIKSHSVIILTLIFISTSFFETCYISYKYGNKDTRLYAYEYISKNLKNEDKLVGYGQLPFNAIIKKKSYKRITKFKNVYAESELPAFALLAVPNLLLEDVTTGDRDTRKMEGNEGDYLLGADLLFYKNSINNFGPNVYIFKINDIQD